MPAQHSALLKSMIVVVLTAVQLYIWHQLQTRLEVAALEAVVELNKHQVRLWMIFEVAACLLLTRSCCVGKTSSLCSTVNKQQRRLRTPFAVCILIYPRSRGCLTLLFRACQFISSYTALGYTTAGSTLIKQPGLCLPMLPCYKLIIINSYIR